MKDQNSKAELAGNPGVDSREMLVAWFARLTELARVKGVSWMISPNMWDHHEAYHEGLTPEEELEEQIDAARRTTQAQRPGPRDAWIATWTRWPGSLQRMVRRHYHWPCWMNRSVLPSGSST